MIKFNWYYRRGSSIILPECNGCGKIIEDFKQANIVVNDDAFDEFTTTKVKRGTIRLEGEVEVYCWGCRDDHKPWRRLSTVLMPWK